MEDKKKEIKMEQNSEVVMHQINRKFFVILAVLLLLQLGIVLYCAMVDWKTEKDSIRESESLTVRVIGSADQEKQMSETEVIETETEKLILEESNVAAKAEFLSLIFDEKENAVGRGQLDISGLSSGAKAQLGFREAEFITELTNFLQEQKIEASEIVFEKEIMTSAENVSGYQLEISGKEEVQLVALFFPKLPGQYLFALLEKEEQEIQESADQQQNMVVEVPVPVQMQTEAAVSENTYDASTLTITGIPEKLLNYLDNRYELQYSLYDYLYKNGQRDVKSVSVESYEIYAEEKKAEIILAVENRDNLTGIYDKEKKTYLFY